MRYHRQYHEDVPWWQRKRVRAAVAVLLCLSFLYTFGRSMVDFTTVFQERLEKANYSNVSVTKKSGSWGTGKSQQLYVARTQVGGCLLQFELRQHDNDYKLVAVNGKLLDPPLKNPVRDIVVIQLAKRGFKCS